MIIDMVFVVDHRKVAGRSIVGGYGWLTNPLESLMSIHIHAAGRWSERNILVIQDGFQKVLDSCGGWSTKPGWLI